MHLAEHLSPAQATVAAYQDAFLTGAVIAVLAAAASMVRPSPARAARQRAERAVTA
jgi:hypothetical protein